MAKKKDKEKKQEPAPKPPEEPKESPRACAYCEAGEPNLQGSLTCKDTGEVVGRPDSCDAWRERTAEQIVIVHQCRECLTYNLEALRCWLHPETAMREPERPPEADVCLEFVSKEVKVVVCEVCNHAVDEPESSDEDPLIFCKLHEGAREITAHCDKFEARPTQTCSNCCWELVTDDNKAMSCVKGRLEVEEQGADCPKWGEVKPASPKEDRSLKGMSMEADMPAPDDSEEFNLYLVKGFDHEMRVGLLEIYRYLEKGGGGDPSLTVKLTGFEEKIKISMTVSLPNTIKLRGGSAQIIRENGEFRMIIPAEQGVLPFDRYRDMDRPPAPSDAVEVKVIVEGAEDKTEGEVVDAELPKKIDGDGEPGLLPGNPAETVSLDAENEDYTPLGPEKGEADASQGTDHK